MLHGLMNAWSLSLFSQNLSNSKRSFHKTIYAISMTPLFLNSMAKFSLLAPSDGNSFSLIMLLSGLVDWLPAAWLLLLAVAELFRTAANSECEWGEEWYGGWVDCECECGGWAATRRSVATPPTKIIVNFKNRERLLGGKMWKRSKTVGEILSYLVVSRHKYHPYHIKFIMKAMIFINWCENKRKNMH